MSVVQHYRCFLCNPHATFSSRADLHIHKSRYHREIFGAGENQDLPWEENEDPFNSLPDGGKMKETYFDNSMYILAKHQLLENLVVPVFNFPVKGQITDANIDLQMKYM